MTIETFFTNFGHLADAPNGVKKLRELILQLAVQGKLVPQDPEDEPASVLLGGIEAERKALVKAGSVRKPKVYKDIELEEQFCSIPSNWCWARMGELILDITGGGTPSKNNPSYWDGDIPWASVKDVGKSKYLDSTIDKISVRGLENSSSNLIPKGRVIICTRMGLGKISINRIDVAINQDLKALWLPENLAIDYFYNFFLTQDIKGSGMTVAGIRQDALLEMPVPLPPLEEQKRIVAKVDQLMTLCNELEARQQKQQQGRVRLNNAALDALLTAREPVEFADHWQRISTNFDLLYDHPETIAKLRAAILQLAVQGKLVPQDPNDEPALILLERIKAEKERLVEEGRFRKTKPVPSVDSENAPYQVPSEWMWVKLDAVANIGTGTTPSKTNPLYYADGSVPWITSSATSKDLIRDSETYVSELAVKECRLRKYPPGTLVVALYGQGKTRGQVAELVIEATVNQACSTINVGENFPELKSYIRILLEKQYDELRALAAGGAQPNLNVGKIKDIVVPLPPQEEQKRIVAKVDQLMSLCDKLEAKLNQAQQHSETLMEATVRQLLVA